jgi:hypothetical protein
MEQHLFSVIFCDHLHIVFLLPFVAIPFLIFLLLRFINIFIPALTNSITRRMTSNGQAYTSVITVTSLVPPGTVITTNANANSHVSKSNVGAIVGGVVGGTLPSFFPIGPNGLADFQVSVARY